MISEECAERVLNSTSENYCPPEKGITSGLLLDILYTRALVIWRKGNQLARSLHI